MSDTATVFIILGATVIPIMLLSAHCVWESFKSDRIKLMERKINQLYHWYVIVPEFRRNERDNKTAAQSEDAPETKADKVAKSRLYDWADSSEL